MMVLLLFGEHRLVTANDQPAMVDERKRNILVDDVRDNDNAMVDDRYLA